MSRVTGQNNNYMSCDDEAVYWQARIASGDMSQEENFLFERWLEAAEQNKIAFSKLTNVLSCVDEAAEELLAKEFEDELHDQIHDNKFSYNQIAAMAATLLMVCASVVAIILFDVLPSQSRVYATATGERNQYTLGDGSQIELNTSSVVEVQYSRTERSVKLSDGQAVFAVERDRDRPFVVSTKHADIVVTGTVFDVNTFGEKSTVNVITGAVTVKPAKGREVTLLAGDSVTINAAGEMNTIQSFDPYAALAWRSGKLVFDEVPLRDVVTELNRYFSKPIVVEDGALTSLAVTGEFDIEKQDAAVRALSLIFSLEIASEPERVLLSKGAE
ncbi:MAG: iron dicitrate transporter FecR [Hyphococcus sp.]|nr:MAG: iron dicitrate transporter FecR [Marinicaulis sp.]